VVVGPEVGSSGLAATRIYGFDLAKRSFARHNTVVRRASSVGGPAASHAARAWTVFSDPAHAFGIVMQKKKR